MKKQRFSKMTVQMLIDELSTIDPTETVIAHFYLTRKAKNTHTKQPLIVARGAK